IVRLVPGIEITVVGIITHAQVQRESRRYLPVVLRVEREQLCAIAKVELRIPARKHDVSDNAQTVQLSLRARRGSDEGAAGKRPRLDLAGSETLRELARVVCDLRRRKEEVVLRRGQECEQPAERGLVRIVDSEFESV